ncbi:MAG: glycosyltransferase [Candidatus Anstonellales archaeon]
MNSKNTTIKTIENELFDFSLVIPVYMNEENILDLLNLIRLLKAKLKGLFEVIFVVDGSPDHSYELLSEMLPNSELSSQLLLLSRNFGSFTAIRVGIEVARGKYIAVMSADLQEPFDLILSFFDLLKKNEADIVFGVRKSRKDNIITQLCSNLFWTFYRKFVMPDVPKGGIDVFAINDKVKNAILNIVEPNSSLVSQLMWIGFRRRFIPYNRLERTKGKSAWKMSRKFRYMLDSFFSFSDLPITILLLTGAIGIFVSIILITIVLFSKITGKINVPGYTATITLQLFFFSLLLFTQGIIGSYLWRTFENTKRRPLSFVQFHSYFNSVEKQ